MTGFELPDGSGVGSPLPSEQFAWFMALPLSALASDSAGDVAHLIETALTPVFMLSGVGTLLNLLNTRSARVADQIEKASDLLGDESDEASHKHLVSYVERLTKRTMVLDAEISQKGCTSG
ncbi:DUF2721 domain-containing protein [Acetobacter estunensis]|uniref:DUF2721 domain-containing protein n=1 Tax=Acetobacter estunensis TaxID=104097 RepID=A0A967EI35_9PROT|nr:DUF2721 domain-containing protein [Acetobacter estunensis]NHO54787.1 DUF2721 domain-containing protein [Acetobacter estunensis]